MPALDLTAFKPVPHTSGDAGQVSGGFSAIETWGNDGIELSALVQAGATPGQTLVWNGTSWAPGTIAGAGGSAPRGTILPASPADGDEFVYVVNAANGVNWRFKYNAASASAYKWEFIGGPPLLAAVATDELNSGATANTFFDLPTVGPSVTLPLAGDYDFDLFAATYGTTGPSVHAGLKFGAATTDGNDSGAVFLNTVGSAAKWTGISRVGMRRVGLAAAVVVKMQYMADQNQALLHFLQRTVSARPVRVSG